MPTSIGISRSLMITILAILLSVTVSPQLLAQACTNPSAEITIGSHLCYSGNNIASVPDAGPGATYLWTATAGGTIRSGNGTRKVWLAPSYSSTSMTVGVTVTVPGGCSATNSVTVPASRQLSRSIVKPATVCPGSAGNVASVSTVDAGATYAWAVFNGTLTSGQSTSSITFTAGAVLPVRLQLTITNAGGCSFMTSAVVSPDTDVSISESSFPAAGGSGTISITRTTCTPAPSSSAAWLTLGPVATPPGGGPDYFTFDVAANSSPNARAAHALVGGLTVPVIQKGTGVPGTAGVTVTTAYLAGDTRGLGFEDGTASTARFYYADGVAVKADGTIFVADARNSVIRKIETDGSVGTYAGSPGNAGHIDGTLSAARFSAPHGLAFDALGNLYVSEGSEVFTNWGHTIRKITPAGAVSTVAGIPGSPGSDNGPATAARFNNPNGMVFDSTGNLFVADEYNSLVRKITPGGVVSTWAGIGGPWADNGVYEGPATEVTLSQPSALAIDDTDTLYVVDTDAGAIRKISPAGMVTTLAGETWVYGSEDGVGTAAHFYAPWGIALDASKNAYIADSFNRLIRRIAPDGTTVTMAGSAGLSGTVDGNGSSARFTNAIAIAREPSGNFVIGDFATVRRITPTADVTTVAGSALQGGLVDAAGTAARLATTQLAVDGSGNVYFGQGAVLRKAEPNGTVSTIAGTGVLGNDDGPASTATFRNIVSVDVDTSGNILIADYSSATVRKLSGGVVSTIAGTPGVTGFMDGTGIDARFLTLASIAVAPDGTIYVVDGSAIRKVTSTGTVSLLAGSFNESGFANGSGAAARFNRPTGITVDSSGNIIVADTYASNPTMSNCAIRKITPSGDVTTIFGGPGLLGLSDGSGANGSLTGFRDVTVDGAGNVYALEGWSGAIRKISPSGVIETIAGTPMSFGYAEGTGSDARFMAGGLTYRAGKLYIADHQRLRVATLLAPGGDVNGDGSSTVADVFYLINNLFSGGPGPVGNGDVNGDGSVTVADVFYLINYLFAGGPAPGLTSGATARSAPASEGTLEIRGSEAVREGNVVVVPVYASGSIEIQALALTVKIPAGTQSMSIELVSANATPVFQAAPQSGAAVSLIVAFDARKSPLGLSAEPRVIAKLRLELEPEARGRVSIGFDERLTSFATGKGEAVEVQRLLPGTIDLTPRRTRASVVR